MTRLARGLAVLLVWGLATTGVLAEGRWQKVENKANCEVWNAYPQTGETMTWTGDCVNGRAEGYGKDVWRYLKDGTWTESSYTGTRKDGKRHGRGVYVWASGSRYEGDFRDDKRHGRGVYVWASGSRYAGDFRDNKRHGHGVYLRSNGNRYEGNWRNSKAHGRGVFVFANGDECDAEWSGGNLVGTGKGFHGGRRMKCYFDGKTMKFRH